MLAIGAGRNPLACPMSRFFCIIMIHNPWILVEIPILYSVIIPLPLVTSFQDHSQIVPHCQSTVVPVECRLTGVLGTSVPLIYSCNRIYTISSSVVVHLFLAPPFTFFFSYALSKRYPRVHFHSFIIALSLSIHCQSQNSS